MSLLRNFMVFGYPGYEFQFLN